MSTTDAETQGGVIREDVFGQTTPVDDPLAAFATEPDSTDPDGDALSISSTDDLDDLEPQVMERTWHVKGKIHNQYQPGDPQYREEDFERTYVQKPLSYLAMMQFTALLGRSIDSAMSGPEGFSIERIGDITSAGASNTQSLLDGSFLQRADFDGIDAFVRGFAKLAAYVPDIVAEAQCIWLRVPLRDRLAVMQVWSGPVDEGGLSMSEGEEMLRVFIDQNYAELEDFLGRRLRRVRRTWSRARGQRQEQ